MYIQILQSNIFVMNGFQVRGSQNKMMAEISKTLTGEYKNSNRILCVEAPTGTGKTFAYLLSSIPIATLIHLRAYHAFLCKDKSQSKMSASLYLESCSEFRDCFARLADFCACFRV
jgi:Lhr-like helicase